MERSTLLTAFLVALGMLPPASAAGPESIPTPSASPPEKPCSSTTSFVGYCTDLGDGRLQIGVTVTVPEAPASAPHPGGRAFLVRGYADTPPPPTIDMRCVVGAEGNLRPLCQRADDVEDAEPAEGAPGFTIEDFLALAPASATLHSEPAGLAIRGLPTNFYAAASAHTRSGPLLGQPVTAQFIPVAYSWDFGDGSTALTETPGAPWNDETNEFTETPTSHVYADKGTYTVQLTTHYAVRATIGDGLWWDIPGTLPIASPPMSLQVYSVSTVLVDKDCTEDPSGVGC